MDKQLIITPLGGISFSVKVENADGSHDVIGHMEFGHLDDDGQYVESDDEIIATAREDFDIPAAIPAKVL